jgi:3-dehydroquinate dehydratase-1
VGKIFTSITGPGFIECRRQLKEVKNAELRLDKIRLSEKELRRLWPLSDSWMVTVRDAFLSQKGWKELLQACMSLGPDYVDLDSEIREHDLKALMQLAADTKIRLILSYHDYERTPSYEDLQAKAVSLFERGAHVVKLACMANNYDDNLTLLRLYAEFNHIITIGMGEKGRVSRLNALYFGEMISYAASSQAEAAAPGQFTHEEMRNLEKAMECD